MQGGRNLLFVIQEVYREPFSESVIISSDIVQKMIRFGQFSMDRITIQISNQLAETTISLCLDDGESYTISRFPRSLLRGEESKRSSISLLLCGGLLLTTRTFAPETRQIQTRTSNRWASRTPSQQIRRKNWLPPDSSKDSRRLSAMSRYSASNYILGDSSPISFGRFAQLFKFGSSAAADPADPEIPNLAELPGDTLPISELEDRQVPRLRVQTQIYAHRSVSTPTRLHDGQYLSLDTDDMGKAPKKSASASPSKGKGNSATTPNSGESRWNFF